MLNYKYPVKPAKSIANTSDDGVIHSGDNVAILNRDMIYVEENEATKKLKILHIANSDRDNENLKLDIRVYPDFDIHFVEMKENLVPNLSSNFLRIVRTLHFGIKGGIRLKKFRKMSTQSDGGLPLPAPK